MFGSKNIITFLTLIVKHIFYLIGYNLSCQAVSINIATEEIGLIKGALKVLMV